MNIKQILVKAVFAMLLFSLSPVFGVVAQAEEPLTEIAIVSNDSAVDEAYYEVEETAIFPGGIDGLAEWLSINLQYPERAVKEDVQGRVIVQFIVDKNGFVTNPKILRGVDKDIDKEAIRVVKSMPQWTPGKIGGKPVNSYFVLPISFKFT